jgi:hypothetical protein
MTVALQRRNAPPVASATLQISVILSEVEGSAPGTLPSALYRPT